MEKIYLILPNCDDTNRGDQALIWQTVQLAKEAGNIGKYYMLATKENSVQSSKEGILNLETILPHPSTHFESNNNIQYKKSLKLKWIFVSVLDSVKALCFLYRFPRSIVSKICSKDKKNTLDFIKKADKIFVKGGGFIHSYGGIVNTYANFYDLYHVILALKLKKDVYVLPNSYGPFLSIGSGRLVKRVLSKCKYVSSRESVSKEMLYSNLQVESELHPDLAFYLEMDDDLTKEQISKLNAIPFEKKCVAITVRPYRFNGYDNPEEKYLKYKSAVQLFAKHIYQNGFHPVFVEHTFAKTDHEKDMSCINDIVDMIKQDNINIEYSVYSDLSLTCRQLKYVYSKFEYIVGTRFHSVIFSLASSVPAIAITYGGNKGYGIMKDIGLAEYTVDIAGIENDTLISKFSKLVDETPKVKEKISDYMLLIEKDKQELIDRLRG